MSNTWEEGPQGILNNNTTKYEIKTGNNQDKLLGYIQNREKIDKLSC